MDLQGRDPAVQGSVTLAGVMGAAPPCGSGSGQLPLLVEPEFSADPVAPQPDPEPEDKYTKQRLRRIDAERVPERAFAAADVYRELVLKTCSYADVSRRAWSTAEKTGTRLVWARDLALLAEPRPLGKDGQGWAEVWKAMQWVFTEQAPSEERYRIIAHCPRSFREKWSKIQEARQRASTPPRRPAQPSTPRRTFTRWDEDWGKQGGSGG